MGGILPPFREKAGDFVPLDEETLKRCRHLHFIGIGGSGMFPLVQILHREGYYITGSDNNETETTRVERELGIPVTFG